MEATMKSLKTVILFLGILSIVFCSQAAAASKEWRRQRHSLSEGGMERGPGKNPGGLETRFYRTAQSARWCSQCTGHHAG